ncbi:hypothetical protein Glove_482g55 [Diversispora epigaea]|uniref:Uncharacterized protein n=1 Tax=Diversispora epigaea TaxID=1348612 RepID=A0A397GSV0_9GLOM|nr:hypothetical protein Glove_482g55 [Diversispora epigaea]
MSRSFSHPKLPLSWRNENVENTDTKTIYELMVNSNELELKELSVKLESYLIESKDS